MNFDLDDQQRAFASAAKDFFGGTTALDDARKALDDGAPLKPGRVALADMGFLGITVPESAGGAGCTVLDMAVVAEQAGRVLAGPSLVTAARTAVLLAGDDARLTALADGSTAFAVVDGTWDQPRPVIDGATADAFLVLDGEDLVLARGTVDAGVPMDATRGLATVQLSDREVIGTESRLRWERAERVGQIILAAEDLGTAGRALEIGVAYAKDRMAFGRAIGSYQAVKHALVEVYVGVEQLRSLIWWAAWSADEAPEELPLAAAAVKAAAAGVLEKAAETLIQVHGGIGFTWEHDAHLLWRRAKVDRLLLGDDVDALEEVAQLVLSRAGTEGSKAVPEPQALEPTLGEAVRQ